MPIVFVGVSDPVGSGFVESLPRPGGNMTGFINLEGSLGGKWLELLKEVMPSVKRAAFFYNPEMATYADYYLGPFEAAARSYAIEPEPRQFEAWRISSVPSRALPSGRTAASSSCRTRFWARRNF